MAREALRHSVNGEKSVLGVPSQYQRAKGNTVVTYNDSVPLISGVWLDDLAPPPLQELG